MRQRLLLVVCAGLFCGIMPGQAQEVNHKPVSLVEDWSTHNVIFSEDASQPQLRTVLADSRFWQQYYRRHASDFSVSLCPQPMAGRADFGCHDGPRRGFGRVLHASATRDWSQPLGATTCGAGNCSGGPISQPAKFVYDVTAAPNCNTDYVVTGINAAGSTTAGSMQANIIGFNNLYVNTAGTGLCSGTNSTVLFSYYVGTGTVPSSSVVSLDGTKVAFVENISATSSKLHILTIGTTGTNGTSATAPVTPCTVNGTQNCTTNNAVDTQVAFSYSNSTAPFVDYDDDVAYVATNGTASILHKITGVFQGTPTEVTTNGWPATFTGNPSISTPVFDFTSKHVIVEDANANLDYVDDSVVPAVTHSATLSIGTATINATPVVIDSSRNLVYAIVNNPKGAHAVAVQTNTSLSSTLATVNLGSAMSAVMRQMDFNNAYYIGAAYTSAFMYVVGNDSTGTQHPALYNVGFKNSSFGLNATAANGPLALSTGTTTGVYASPVTEFYGGSVAYTPTVLTQSGTTVTVTTATNSFVSGQVVTIAGVAAGSGGCTATAVAGINGQQTITVLSATQFTFTSTVTATITSGQCTLNGSSATGPTQDYIFVGVSNACQTTGITGGCMRSINLNNGFPTTTTINNTIISASGGTGRASVDNYSTSAGASSIYYTTLTGNTIVKVTQSGLQ